MIFTLLSFVILSIVRAIIVNRYDISPFTGAHMALLAPDLLFFGVMCYWYFIREKGNATKTTLLFFLAYLGSIVWDYQTGFYWLKFFAFPGLLYVITHQEKYNQTSIKQAIMYSFPILHAPFVSIKQFLSEIFTRTHTVITTDTPTAKDEQPETISFSLSKAIWFGIGLGLFILIALATLDPDFASFLQLTKWWDILVDTFSSFIYYLFLFFWYFWKPIRTNWQDTMSELSLNTILHRAVVMIVGIFVGYTFYDGYIALRALHLIKLTFETVGKNTQMNFLELVVLGGGWLFLVAYLINKLKDKVTQKKSTVATIFLLLIVSCIWLTPPVLNILRVLLTVYIPRFGLTARRLFGIYTTIAFVATLLYVMVGGWKKDATFFTKTTMIFFLTITLLSFAVPTNLLIANWHFSRYRNQDTKADFDYFKKIKLEKWGWLFDIQLKPEQHKSDIIWGLAIAEKTNDGEKQDEYKKLMKELAQQEVSNMYELLENTNIQEFQETYGTVSTFKNKRITTIHLTQDRDYLLKRFNSNLNKKNYVTDSYIPRPFILSFNVYYQNQTKTIQPDVISARIEFDEKTDPIVTIMPSRDPSRYPTLFPSETIYNPKFQTMSLRFAEHRSEPTLFRVVQ